ncbi:MAG: hypothetical protein KF897_00475 [Opitutaceae bacterium]|nr:hypothetical protein [Opitutaceae bacterium]
MNAPSRVLRFRPAGSAGCTLPGARRLIDVYLDDDRSPIGSIVRLEPEAGAPARWAFVLSDGRATGLQSTHSRQDLELAIGEHFFHDLTHDGRQTA